MTQKNGGGDPMERAFMLGATRVLLTVALVVVALAGLVVWLWGS